MEPAELYGRLWRCACRSVQNPRNPWRPADVAAKVRRAAEFTRAADVREAANISKAAAGYFAHLRGAAT
jgi:hypothetical protein